MEKKHKNRFSIVFNETYGQQAFAIEKLNSLPSKTIALYIAQAIYAYEFGAKSAPRRAESALYNISEERKGGRQSTQPKDTGNSTATMPMPTSDSLSHIHKQPQMPEDSDVSEQNARSVETRSEEPTVNPDMFRSMMAFLGND